MILINTAEDTIKKNIEQFRAQQDDRMMARLEKQIDFFEGDHIPYIAELIKRKDKEGMPYSYINLTKHIISKLSMVYHNPPERIITGNADKYNELIRNKNVRLKTCEQQARLMPFILVRPWLRTNGNDQYFNYQIIRYFYIFEDVKDIEYPAAVMYPIQTNDNKRIWEYWDRENHFVFSNDGKRLKNQEDYGINPDMLNEYGELPHALLRFDDVIEDIWRGGAFDLVDSNLMIDLALTELNYEFRWQSFKQVYATAGGATDLRDTEVEFGYNKVVKVVGENAQIGILDLQPNFLASIEVIKFQMNTIAMNYNITMKWELSGNAESGFALVVKNVDLFNSWKNDIEHCRRWERDIFAKEKLVYEHDTGKALPAKDMHVDFAEVKFPINPDEERRRWDWEFSHNISTPLDYMKAQSPDTPEDELKKRLEENAKLTGTIKAAEKPKPLTFEERLLGANV